MSLMKSLARVAAGVMLAKGLGTMMQNQQQSRGGQFPGRRRTGGGILGDLMNAGSSRGSQGGPEVIDAGAVEFRAFIEETVRMGPGRHPRPRPNRRPHLGATA